MQARWTHLQYRVRGFINNKTRPIRSTCLATQRINFWMFWPEVIWAPITIKYRPAANDLWRHVSRFPAHATVWRAVKRRRRRKCSVTLLADFSTFSFCTSLQLWVLYFLWALFFLCYGCGRVGSDGSTIDWLCLGYFSRRWANQVIFFREMFLTNSCLGKRLDSIHNHQSRVRFNLWITTVLFFLSHDQHDLVGLLR